MTAMAYDEPVETSRPTIASSVYAGQGEYVRSGLADSTDRRNGLVKSFGGCCVV